MVNHRNNRDVRGMFVGGSLVQARTFPLLNVIKGLDDRHLQESRQLLRRLPWDSGSAVARNVQGKSRAFV